ALGLGLAHTMVTGLFWADTGNQRVEFLHSITLIVLPYLGLVLGAKHGEWLEPSRLLSLFRASGPQRRYKILDTSVIIDGRIADVCETGFVDGKVFILKEGKEYNQGVAYLDDGTMVVVDNARKMISKTIDIVVTSVLQTTAGKMIFGRFIEAGMPAPVPAAAVPAVEREKDDNGRA